MKAWLKGGLIAGGVGFFLGLISVGLLFLNRPINFLANIMVVITYPLLYLFKLIFELIGLELGNDPGVLLLVGPILIVSILTEFFIIGGLIGWIIGKIKSRKQNLNKLQTTQK